MNTFFGLLVMEISENLSRSINDFHGERVQGVSTFTSSILYFRFKILLKINNSAQHLNFWVPLDVLGAVFGRVLRV